MSLLRLLFHCIFISTALAAPQSNGNTLSDQNTDQRLINESLSQLFSTALGAQITTDILGCSKKNIEIHLGASHSTAEKIFTTHCSAPGTQPKSSLIHAIDGLEISKAHILDAHTSRRYRIHYYNPDSPPPFDSWTDFQTHATILFLPQRIDPNAKRVRLLQILAHETAIYFDQKSHLSLTLWNQHPQFRSLQVTSLFSSGQIHLENFLLATNNPLINQVLSFVRAFKVEKLWLEQLANQTSIPMLEQEISSYAEIPFLKETCDIQCFYQFLQLSIQQQNPTTLKSTSHNRYWSMKLLKLSALPPSKKNQEIRKALLNLKKQTSLISLAQAHSFDFDASEESFEQQVFRQILIPEDLAEIFQTILSAPPNKGVHSFWFLTQPSLGNFGIELANGPRPRIRTGSSNYVTETPGEPWSSDLFLEAPAAPLIDMRENDLSFIFLKPKSSQIENPLTSFDVFLDLTELLENPYESL